MLIYFEHFLQICAGSQTNLRSVSVNKAWRKDCFRSFESIRYIADIQGVDLILSVYFGVSAPISR